MDLLDSVIALLHATHRGRDALVLLSVTNSIPADVRQVAVACFGTSQSLREVAPMAVGFHRGIEVQPWKPDYRLNVYGGNAGQALLDQFTVRYTGST